MASPNLLVVCILAFITVFVLLAVLAAIMRAISAIFPAKEIGTDPTIIAALTSAAQLIYPGTKITKIEEMK